MGHRVARLKNFGEASRQAALDMIADINGALGK